MIKERRDILFTGFALFAIFFGAGNLIFPPSLGLSSGTSWYIAAFGFLLTDPVLPVLGVIATSKVGGRAEDLGKRVSPKFAKILGAICILTIGPLFAVPRTATTVYEIAVNPIAPNSPLILTSLIFFAVTYVLVINPSTVIDTIGKYLTPLLLIILTAIIGLSIFNPIGTAGQASGGNLFLNGFQEGYQTMDALGASLMAGIVLTDLVFKGYKDRKKQQYMTKRIGLVAGVLLVYVYGGLTFVGSTAGSVFDQNIERAPLLLGIVGNLFGSIGTAPIALVIALACLTTSIGLTATAANYFNSISNGKLSYKLVATLSVIVSVFLSLFGLEGLIKIAFPVLAIAYPVMITLILMTLFDKYIKYNTTYTGAVIGAFLVSLIETLNGSLGILSGTMSIIEKFPLASFGFPWIFPAIVLGIVGMIYGKMTGGAVFAERNTAI